MDWRFTLIGNAIRPGEGKFHYYNFRDVDFSERGCLVVCRYQYYTSKCNAFDLSKPENGL